MRIKNEKHDGRKNVVVAVMRVVSIPAEHGRMRNRGIARITSSVCLGTGEQGAAHDACERGENA